MILLGIHIGFIEFRILDLIDILLTAFFIYQLYKLLKGSLAFNIFLGLLLIYLSWFVVRALDMQLLSGILDQFIGVGVIALLIVFQPEVRRFLLLLGRGRLIRRSKFLQRLIQRVTGESEETLTLDQTQLAVAKSLIRFSEHRIGALIVFARTSQLQFFANSGTPINGSVSTALLESIFQKNSPLHDGAVIIVENKITAAGCTLPVSENHELPARIGLRHKAGVGITEHSDAVSFIVSEETGRISFCRGGKIEMGLTEEAVYKALETLVGEEESE